MLATVKVKIILSKKNATKLLVTESLLKKALVTHRHVCKFRIHLSLVNQIVSLALK